MYIPCIHPDMRYLFDFRFHLYVEKCPGACIFSALLFMHLKYRIPEMEFPWLFYKCNHISWIFGQWPTD